MGKKTAVTGIVILLFSLVNPGWAQELDPALVAWWQLDGDLTDASGNGHDGGTFSGEAHFEAGLLGEALALDGAGDYVTINGYTGVAGTQSRTVTAWIQTTGLGAIVAWGEDSNGEKYIFRVQNSNGTAGAIRTEVAGGYKVADTDVRDGEWHHVASVIIDDGSPNVTEVLHYLDGVLEGSSASADEPIDTADTHDVWIGFDHGSRPFPGLIDELRLYDRVLTANEIAAQALRPKAYNPSPADGTIGVNSPLFSWQPRQTALFHDVYLGTDLNLGPADLVGPRWVATIYWHAPGLEPGTTYYWRIDEVEPDGTTYTGDVWSFFSTPLEAWQPDPIDGEPYTDPNVTLTWAGGASVISHDVYFGAGEAEVAEGAGDAFKGNTLLKSFVTGDLEPDTTYYWRVDEVDQGGAKITGDLWRFKTLPEIAIGDPNLVAWWNFNAGIGPRAVDWSGHGNHGALRGADWLTPGWIGESALNLIGGGYVAIENLFYDDPNATEVTACAWIRTSSEADQYILSFDRNEYYRLEINSNGAGPGQVGWDVMTTAGQQIDCGSVRRVDDGQWHHVCGVFDTGVATIYIDGSPEPSATGGLTFGTGNVRYGLIGRNSEAIAFDGAQGTGTAIAGDIDDLRIYDKALTQDEILQAMRGDPLLAWDLQPTNGQIVDIRELSALRWQAGDIAGQHDVYLGTDPNAVFAADASDATGVYRGRQNGTTYVPPEGFAWGQTYYWRIDEVNTDGTLTSGGVRTFTVADYLIVETFESYSNNVGERVFETWIDGIGFTMPPPGNAGNGTGAAVGHDIWSADSPYLNGIIMERNDVYAGAQAMPLYYDNTTTPYYSQADRSWTSPQDWTSSDVNTLHVAFKGQPVAFLETAPDSVTISAAGTDIWGTADEFTFAHKSLNGDCTAVARIDSLVETHTSAKAGLMIRESLDPGSRFAMAHATGGNGFRFTRRQATGSTVANDGGVATAEQNAALAPLWMKLERLGNEFNGYYSNDPATEGWTASPENPQTVVMGGTIYVGLAVTSHSAGNPTTAEFSGIEITGASGPWEFSQIGVDHPVNDPADLYVALQDSVGRIASVPYANGVIVSEWTPWYVSLDDFTGVNLAAVKMLSIGIGDPANATADGTGRVFIDEIRLTRGVPAEPNEPNAVE